MIVSLYFSVLDFGGTWARESSFEREVDSTKKAGSVATACSVDGFDGSEF